MWLQQVPGFWSNQCSRSGRLRWRSGESPLQPGGLRGTSTGRWMHSGRIREHWFDSYEAWKREAQISSSNCQIHEETRPALTKKGEQLRLLQLQLGDLLPDLLLDLLVLAPLALNVVLVFWTPRWAELIEGTWVAPLSNQEPQPNLVTTSGLCRKTTKASVKSREHQGGDFEERPCFATEQVRLLACTQMDQDKWSKAIGFWVLVSLSAGLCDWHQCTNLERKNGKKKAIRKFKNILKLETARSFQQRL